MVLSPASHHQVNLPASAEPWEQQAGRVITDFRLRTVSAFTIGYFGEGAQPDPLLDLFLLEKAAYEVGYEAANRPDWIGVPATALGEVAARLIGKELP